MKKRILNANILMFFALLLFFPGCCLIKKTDMVSKTMNNQVEIKIGGQLMKTSVVGSDSWKDPIGFNVGGGASKKVQNVPVVLSAEALLSLQGAKWEIMDLKGRTDFWYINVPLMAQYLHPSGFFAEAGLQPGFLLKATDKYEGEKEDFMEYMNRFDLAVPIGVGYKLKNNFAIDFRVTPGILDITTDADDKERNLTFGVGLSYYFGKK